MASGGTRRRFWEPATRPSEPVGDDDDDDDGGSAWVAAPAGSHIARFRFFDARDVPLLKNFGAGATQSGGVRRSEGASELHVKFRDEKTGGETVAWVYHFPAHAEGKDVFERMAVSPHPYGFVLYPEVIKPGTPRGISQSS